MSTAETRGEAYAFGPFRLDVGERLLLRGESPIPLRAKLFDTLVELVRRAGSLVTRGELIARVWPDAIVEEGNLSHNVSALRRALGDPEEAQYIETVPRVGYRFVHPLESAPSPAAAARAEGELDRARRLFADGAWEEAYAALSSATRTTRLAGDDAARLAEAACWTARYGELVPLLEAALEAYRREDDACGASRVALRLATVMLDRRRLALAASYTRQAERLLAGATCPVREEAELERVRGRLCWAESDWEGGLARARRAAELAHALGNRETEALAQMDIGHTLLALDRVGEALEPLEVSGAIFTTGEMGTYASGMTVCGLILAWRACGRMDRAVEWVDAYGRWSDESGTKYFPGLCRIHRGEVSGFRGELAQAEHELAHGVGELEAADSGNAGPGYRDLGTVRLRRGDLSGAEAAFSRALEFGTDPQPGFAQLLVARGELEAARRELERFLSEEGGAERNILEREYRFEALAALVSVALATGQRARAKEALARLEAMASASGAEYHRAAAEGAAAELALDENRGADAQRLARESWRRWSALEMPYPSALARELLGRALRAAGDAGRGRIELEGAARSLERLGAELDLRRVRARMDEFGAATPSAPRLVACGMVVGAATLRALLGDAGWADLTGWLERTLTRCWRDHGGAVLGVAEGRFAVAFPELASCLSCAAHVQRSLREHRSLHGFAPPLRLAIADASALAAEPDLDLLRRCAEDLVSSGETAEVIVLADPAVAGTSASLARLREEGVSVRLVGP